MKDDILEEHFYTPQCKACNWEGETYESRKDARSKSREHHEKYHTGAGPVLDFALDYPYVNSLVEHLEQSGVGCEELEEIDGTSGLRRISVVIHAVGWDVLNKRIAEWVRGEE